VTRVLADLDLAAFLRSDLSVNQQCMVNARSHMQTKDPELTSLLKQLEITVQIFDIKSRGIHNANDGFFLLRFSALLENFILL
jgi:hypothetical protein